VTDDRGMLELRLRSGAVVAFDGRILEVFDMGPSRRFHVARLDDPLVADHADGSRTVTLEHGLLSISFAREERPACDRLLVALAGARTADERLR
jgi:hypothetical protein